MKKRKLKAALWDSVGYEPGDEDDDCTGNHLVHIVERRVYDLHETREIASRAQRRAEDARAAARLWKRAAKRYRQSLPAFRLQAIECEADKMREERDALLFERNTNHEYVHQTSMQRNAMREERDAAFAEARQTRADCARLLERNAVLMTERDAAFRVRDEFRAAWSANLPVDVTAGFLGPTVEAHRAAELEALQQESARLREERDSALAAKECHPENGEGFCGYCQTCLSRVNAHLHKENKSLLTDIARMSEERDAARADCDKMQGERDASVLDYEAEFARMHPVVEACESAYDEMDPGDWLSRSRIARAVEAYRAGGELTLTPHGIYIASKTKHAVKWRRLRDSGVNIISTWIDEAGPGETGDWQDLWRRCIGEASRASELVVYVERGDVLKGALVEIGAAMASGVPVRVVGDPDGQGSWWRAHGVTVTDEWNGIRTVDRSGGEEEPIPVEVYKKGILSLLDKLCQAKEDVQRVTKERDEARAEAIAPHTWSEADKMREERDAARKGVDLLAGDVSRATTELARTRQAARLWKRAAKEYRLGVHSHREGSTQAFDQIAVLCGCPQWDYPGQLVRDVETLRNERDRLQSQRAACHDRLRDTAQILIKAIGADRPMNAEDAARKAVVLIESLQQQLSLNENLGEARPVDLVEKVAQAIYHTDGGMTDEDYLKVCGKNRKLWETDAPWDSNPEELAEHEREDYRMMAQAAIQAITRRHGGHNQSTENETTSLVVEPEDNRKPDEKTIVFIINGVDVPVTIGPQETLASARDSALQESDNTSRPVEEWDIRDEKGLTLPPEQRTERFNFVDGVRLFLVPQCGAGGHEVAEIGLAFCVHCGRVYLESRDNGMEDREACVCGAELYPVTKTVVLGEELQAAEGRQIRVVGCAHGSAPLVAVCRKFIDGQQITCPESIFQCDRVSLNALPFIKEICGVVGYATVDDGDEA